MIDLYTVPTPNGHKISIMLEETGLPYNLIAKSIAKGDQFQPEFLKINPNGKFPALVDHDPIGGGAPISVFETGAMLIYLADKSGKFLPREPARHYETLQWLMWQMAGLGPMHGQANHFVRYAPEHHEYATVRYMRESIRLLNVLDGQLKGREWIAAGEYTLADIACWPWIRAIRLIDLDLADFPNIKRWYEKVEARPGVERGKKVINDLVYGGKPMERRQLTAEHWSWMFGDEQYKKRG